MTKIIGKILLCEEETKLTVKPVKFRRKVIDASPPGRQNNVALVFADIGNIGKPSIIVKPYNPYSRVELWENVTEY